MAKDILKVESNERVDLVDFEFLADEQFQSGLRQLGEEFFTDPTKSVAWILDGFEITNPTGAQVQVDLGRALLGQREGGQIHQSVLVSEGEVSRTIDLSTYANGAYGIYVRFEYVEGDSSSRAFWNPQGSGSEFAQTIATRRLANWSLRIELASPGAEWLQIGSVTVAAGAISVGPTDERPLYFEGTVDSTYESGWSSDGGGSANDRNSDRQQYGVKDLQTFTAAVRQCLEDIKGRGLRRWWERDIGGMNIGFDAAPTENELKVGDANFKLDWSSAQPALQFDSNDDRMYYDRTSNEFRWEIGGTEEVYLSSAGVEIVKGLIVGYTGTPLNEQITSVDDNFSFWGNQFFPLIMWDSFDYEQYDRNNNEYQWIIGTVQEMALHTTGLEIADGLVVGHAGTPVSDVISLGDPTFRLRYDSGTGDGYIEFEANSNMFYDTSANTLGTWISSLERMRVSTSGLNVYQGARFGNVVSTAPTADAIQIGPATGDRVNLSLGTDVADLLYRDSGIQIQDNGAGTEGLSFLFDGTQEAFMNPSYLAHDGYFTPKSSLRQPSSQSELRGRHATNGVMCSCRWIMASGSPVISNSTGYNVSGSGAMTKTGTGDYLITTVVAVGDYQALSVNMEGVNICWAVQLSSTTFQVRITNTSGTSIDPADGLEGHFIAVGDSDNFI